MPSIERTEISGLAGHYPDAEVLSRLLAQRYSCRAFRPEPVPHETIETMLALAQGAASWCNSQPWQVHVTEGDATERLRTALFDRARAQAANGGLAADPDLPFPEAYVGIYKDRQREVGWQLYEAVGVVHGDRVGSGRQVLENFRLFDAPHALIITTERSLGQYGVLDCGIYLGTLALAAQSLGIGFIAQAALAHYAPLLREFFAIPDNRDIVCGASFGFADTAHRANSFRSRRADVTDAASWHR